MPNSPTPPVPSAPARRLGLPYIHPIDLLSSRLFTASWDASQLVQVTFELYEIHYYDVERQRMCYPTLRADAYCDKPDRLFYAPARQSLRLALPAAIGISSWLRWGMQEQSGVFETELRSALRELNSWVGEFPKLPFYDVLKPYLAKWNANVDKISTMASKLEDVAVESRDPAEWIESLRNAREASENVSRSLNAIYSAAVAASPDLNTQAKVARATIVSLRVILETIGPRFVYLLDDDEYAEGLWEQLPDLLFERVEQLCRWSEQRRNPEEPDPAIRERLPGTPVAKHLTAFEDGISYLLDPPRAQDMPQGPPLPRKRRQRVGKADQKAFEQAREDSIAEIIRSIARDGSIVTSGDVALRSKRQDGKSIPEGTIRNSESWRNRKEIASKVRGDTSYMDKYRGVDGFTSDERFLDDQESES